MKIKDRFTTYINYEKGYPPKQVRAIYDHKQGKKISEMEAESICHSEYGEHFNTRTKVITKTVELIKAEIDHYNDTCEEGFEIKIEDIIRILSKEKWIG